MGKKWLITFFIIFIFSCCMLIQKYILFFLFRCLELKCNENKLINIFSLNAFYIGLTNITHPSPNLFYYFPPLPGAHYLFACAHMIRLREGSISTTVGHHKGIVTQGQIYINKDENIHK